MLKKNKHTYIHTEIYGMIFNIFIFIFYSQDIESDMNNDVLTKTHTMTVFGFENIFILCFSK